MSEEDVQQEAPVTEGQGLDEEQHQADIQQEASAVVEEAEAPGIAAEAGLADLADAYAEFQADSKDDVSPAVGDATPDGDNQSKDQQQDVTHDAAKTAVAAEEEQKSEEQTAEDANAPATVEQAATERVEKTQDTEDSELKQDAADSVSQDVGNTENTDVVSHEVEEQAAEPETKDEPPATERIDRQSEQPAAEKQAAEEPNGCTQEEPTEDNHPRSDTAAVTTEPTGPPALYQGFGIESQKGEHTVEEKESKEASKDSKKQDAAPPKSMSQKTLNAAAKKTSPAKKAALVEAPAADTIKAHHPWLDGTFRTPKGRVVTAKELCESIDKMTRAYASKQLDGNEDGSPAPPQNPSQYNTKKLSSDELESVVSRLYTSKSAADAAEAGQLERVTLKFDEQGNEQWVPVKKADPDENRAYMCALYERCLEQRKKTEEDLAAKYLQPLGKPRKVAC